MSERIHGLVQLLPGKTTFEECSLEELQHLTKRFPYFAPARFLLLQKLKETGSPDYETQHRQAVLYFHEPLLFDYFISADKFNMDEAGLGAAKTTATRPAAPLVEETCLEPAAAESDTFIPEEKNADEESDKQVGAPEPDKVDETALDELPQPALLPVSPLPEIPKEAVLEGGAGTAQINREKAGLTIAPPLSSVPAAKETPAMAAVSEKPSSLQTEPAEAELPQQTKGTEPLAFEPYHTVDYFASQGIKISSDALPKDKLSKQVRSFTEWLKVMKRLPAPGLEAAAQSPAEKTVESLANHSVEGSEVVTEAMAEVWARQGNTRKAIETYNKLSLQNPSKKAYFASKIENLSGT